jgi:hypothetical protein
LQNKVIFGEIAMSAEPAVDSEALPVAPAGRPSRFNLGSIAKLANDQIHGALSNAELIEIIRSVDYPFAGKDRLEYFDRDTLARVVCLVRRWSCQQIGVPTL